MRFSVKKAAKRFGLAAFLFFFIKGLVWLAVFFGVARLFFPKTDNPVAEELHVWHAYATDSNQQTLYFQMVVPETIQDTSIIVDYGRHFLKERMVQSKVIKIRHCPTCKIEGVKDLEKAIKKKGYAVYD